MAKDQPKKPENPPKKVDLRQRQAETKQQKKENPPKKVDLKQRQVETKQQKKENPPKQIFKPKKLYQLPDARLVARARPASLIVEVWNWLSCGLSNGLASICLMFKGFFSKCRDKAYPYSNYQQRQKSE